MGKKRKAAKKVAMGSKVSCTGVGFVGNAPHEFKDTAGVVVDIDGDNVSVGIGTHGPVRFTKDQLKVVK